MNFQTFTLTFHPFYSNVNLPNFLRNSMHQLYTDWQMSFLFSSACWYSSFLCYSFSTLLYLLSPSVSPFPLPTRTFPPAVPLFPSIRSFPSLTVELWFSFTPFIGSFEISPLSPPLQMFSVFTPFRYL